jgi:tRNA (cytidine/uridine-2'-O-)-methyltransferase
MPLNIVLVEPEIPQNTGNIARTCAVTGAKLHLIEPLGFSLEDRYLKRAGLDYWNRLELMLHGSLNHFINFLSPEADILLTTKRGSRWYADITYGTSSYVLFGRESAGLPEHLLYRYPARWIRLPMRPGTRSLNLSNAAAVITYEALRQQDFPGLV